MEGLITRYQPKTLPEFWGNDSIKQRWMGYIEMRDFPHSIILNGVLGVGKSTLAPIFCNDIIRLVPDIRGFKGVEPRNLGPADYEYARIKEILNSTYQGLYSTKVLFLDEAHRMREEKIQELFLTHLDKNQRLYCIFATTETKKINPALRSSGRSTLFTVEPPPLDVLKEKLAEIARKEEIPISAGPFVSGGQYGANYGGAGPA